MSTRSRRPSTVACVAPANGPSAAIAFSTVGWREAPIAHPSQLSIARLASWRTRSGRAQPSATKRARAKVGSETTIACGKREFAEDGALGLFYTLAPPKPANRRPVRAEIARYSPMSATREPTLAAQTELARAFDARLLANRLRAACRGDVLFDVASRGRYATDASIYQI